MTAMMRFLLPLLATVPLMFAADAKPDVQKAVFAAEQQYVDAMVRADRAALERVLTDDLVYTHSSSQIDTKDDLVKEVTSGKTKYTSIDFQDRRVRQFGDTAVVTEKAMIQTVQNGLARLLVTHVWARQNGQWRLASRQATRLPAQ